MEMKGEAEFGVRLHVIENPADEHPKGSRIGVGDREPAKAPATSRLLEFALSHAFSWHLCLVVFP
jgi:hypothetical protein